MQRIERYGVIALVLLLVTIAAVSFWDDGGLAPGKDKPKSRNTERVAKQEARRKPAVKSNNLPSTAGRKSSGSGQGRKKSNSNVAPQRPTGKQSYTTLPATITPKPPVANGGRRGSVEFPDSLKGSDPRIAGGQATPPAPANNYDSIAARREALQRSQRAEMLKAAEQDTVQPVVKRTDPVPDPTLYSGETYTVVAGDTLSQISYKTLKTSKRWREIQQLNGNIDPSALFVGAVLKIPTDGASTSTQSLPELDAPGRAPVAADGYYIVRKGDVLSQIAQNELGGASRWREIAALNPAIDPNVLYEGARLRMPSTNVAASRYTPKASSGSKKKNRVR